MAAPDTGADEPPEPPLLVPPLDGELLQAAASPTIAMAAAAPTALRRKCLTTLILLMIDSVKIIHRKVLPEGRQPLVDGPAPATVTVSEFVVIQNEMNTAQAPRLREFSGVFQSESPRHRGSIEIATLNQVSTSANDVNENEADSGCSSKVVASATAGTAQCYSGNT